MATHKNALIRYQVLDRCFRNSGREYKIIDLLEECNKELTEFNGPESNIEIRQLYDDIRFMQSEQGWNIPLIRTYKGKSPFYRYEDLNFSISNSPLNQVEINQLQSAIAIVSRFKGTEQFEWIDEMVPLLENKLGIKGENRKVIEYESNIDYEGIKNISPIFNAIINERVLKVLYKDFKSEHPYCINFHPQYLKQYNNRWFVIGLNSDKNIATWNMALDRILSIIESSETYNKLDTDWDEYFYDIVGVTKPNSEPSNVELLFEKNQAPYILTKPIHPSQKYKIFEDGKLQVRLKLIINYEFEMLLLSFGETLEVIAPKELRMQIGDRFRNAVMKY